MKNAIHDPISLPAFRPDSHHRTVQAVFRDPNISSDEKRAILSAWASDMYAVESSPTLRMIPGHATPLRLSEILSALSDLDDDDPPPRGGAAKKMPVRSAEADGCAEIPPIVYQLARARPDPRLRLTKMQAHRDNVRRYKRILATGLTDLERQFVTLRLAEEQSAIRKLSTSRGTNDDISFAAGC